MSDSKDEKLAKKALTATPSQKSGGAIADAAVVLHCRRL